MSDKIIKACLVGSSGGHLGHQFIFSPFGRTTGAFEQLSMRKMQEAGLLMRRYILLNSNPDKLFS